MSTPVGEIVRRAHEPGAAAVRRPPSGALRSPTRYNRLSCPPVVVSLWRVDDEATKALMTAFYENWKTMPAATALKRAREHVRSQERWKHPYFWAAWQLWGLGD